MQTCNLYPGYQNDLNRRGFRCFTKEEIDDFCTDGIILPDGTFVYCGYMGHNNLYYELHKLKITTWDDWLSDDTNVIISSGQLHGTVAHNLKDKYRERVGATEEQLQTLFAMRSFLTGDYAFNPTTICELLLKNEQNIHELGGKYNNLQFLKHYYPHIKTPTISAIVGDLKTDVVFIRTSPVKSLPGLLNSILVDNDQDSTLNAIDFINREFTKYLGVLNEQYGDGKGNIILKDNNKLNIFFQEFIEGSNGVCNYSEDGFKYSLSKNQGDIVKGKQGDVVLSQEHHDLLEQFSSELYESLGEKLIQLEFVVNETGLYIVQLRTLDPPNYIASQTPECVFVEGSSFTKGEISVDVNDILVVDEDCESSQLIGKKALIVKGGNSFSHILALSKMMKIPSMYNVTKFDFPEEGTVIFNTQYKNAWITM